MPGFAELELSLHRRDGGYALELRYAQPESDADVRLLRDETTPVRLDAARLRELATEPEEYGAYLGQAIFADPAVREAFAMARANAQSHEAPLRVRLFVGGNAPELQGLRWETLRDPRDGASLVTSEGLLFSRYLSSADWRPVRLRPQSDLRALVMVANPTNLARYSLAPIDVVGELRRAKAALGRTPITALAGPGRATLNNLMARLRDGYDILYLVAHGALAQGEPLIWLESEDGTVARAMGSELAARLQELRERPRLVVLASCQSAGTGEGSEALSVDGRPLAALGPRLAEAGVPAVLAMQGQVSMQTVAEFMPVFFGELGRDGQIDRAMAAARGAVRHRDDAWMPVLFMRLKSGRIWYVPGFGDERKGFEKWPALVRTVRQGRCTPILGAGVAEPLLGSTRELARRWAETYGYPMAQHATEDLPQVAQYVAVDQDEGFVRAELHEALRQELLRRWPEVPEVSPNAGLRELLRAAGAALREANPAEPHRVLAAQPFPLFITTNPDYLLEAALEAVGKQPRTLLCPWNDYVERSQDEYDELPTPERPLVYHLFGILDEPDSLVLTEDDYFNYLIGVTSNRKLIPEVVRRALADTALLFLGFRVDDWNFRVIFRSFMGQEGRGRRRKYTHVAAQLDPEEGRIREPERARRFLESYFQSDDISLYWGSSEDFIRDLASRLGS